ncbi:MAG: hypothetical protein NTW38_10035 [Candidatus Aminicenantes bacterium]|nr:hypothetical protein [Candidatus Aminicenantes bacterium]
MPEFIGYAWVKPSDLWDSHLTESMSALAAAESGPGPAPGARGRTAAIELGKTLIK